MFHLLLCFQFNLSFIISQDGSIFLTHDEDEVFVTLISLKPTVCEIKHLINCKRLQFILKDLLLAVS